MQGGIHLAVWSCDCGMQSIQQFLITKSLLSQSPLGLQPDLANLARGAFISDYILLSIWEVPTICPCGQPCLHCSSCCGIETLFPIALWCAPAKDWFLLGFIGFQFWISWLRSAGFRIVVSSYINEDIMGLNEIPQKVGRQKYLVAKPLSLFSGCSWLKDLE